MAVLQMEFRGSQMQPASRQPREQSVLVPLATTTPLPPTQPSAPPPAPLLHSQPQPPTAHPPQLPLHVPGTGGDVQPARKVALIAAADFNVFTGEPLGPRPDGSHLRGGGSDAAGLHSRAAPDRNSSPFAAPSVLNATPGPAPRTALIEADFNLFTGEIKGTPLPLPMVPTLSLRSIVSPTYAPVRHRVRHRLIARRHAQHRTQTPAESGHPHGVDGSASHSPVAR